MRFVQRDKDGKLIGHFGLEQSYATEVVPDDHPDILAWDVDRKARELAAMAASPKMLIPALQERIARLEGRVAGLESAGR